MMLTRQHYGPFKRDEYQVVCPVYGCGATYSTGNRFNYDIPCPICGCTVNEVDNAGTNDPELLVKNRIHKGGKR